MTLLQGYFFLCAAAAVSGALAVVLAKNPIRSAMGLLLLILSVAGLFLSLHAQFLAAIQLIVYAGAIVVLFLFVIMLLGPAARTPSDKRGVVVRTFGGSLFVVVGLAALGAIARAWALTHRALPMPNPEPSFGGIDAFGTVLFADALIPFELSSALLMVAVLGAIGVARGRQGFQSLSREEREIARGPAPDLPQERTGVYSHELGAPDDGAHAGGGSA